MLDFKQTLGTDEELILKKFEKWTHETGEHPFIYYGEENKTYTYAQFNELVNAFANNLIANGIQKIVFKKKIHHRFTEYRRLNFLCKRITLIT